MKKTKNYLAFDLGASNGRCMVGTCDGNAIHLETLSQFGNGPVRLRNHYFWNILGLYEQIKLSLCKAASVYGSNLSSLAVDTWGVDFALLDGQGNLVSNPYIYRDPQTEGMIEAAFERMPKEEIFEQTGIIFLRLNSLFQLLALVIRESPLLEIAQTYLMIPDLINYWLSGRAVCDYTIASTSHMLDARKKLWAYPIIRAMGIPEHIFPPIIQPGQVLERLDKLVAKETSLTRLPVVAIASHDTASAVVSVPAKTKDYLYLSSGTWGLLGTLTPEPIINHKVMKYNLSNEGGVFNTIRLLKLIPNLWLLQECWRIWAQEGEDLSWDELVSLAEQAKPFMASVNPEADDFTLPDHMPLMVQQTCRDLRQEVPQSKGEIVRVCLESLAFSYRYTIDQLFDVLGQKPEVLHILGGGTKNRLLNQFTANATHINVVTGPTEAAVLGNIIMQMIALGDISGLEEGRELLRASFPTETYSPFDSDLWEDQYQKFLKTLDLHHIQ